MSVNLFDVNFYRAANSDLAVLTDRQAYAHFITSGLTEGRAFSPLVDLKFYQANNRDLAGLDNRQLLQHLENFGVQEGRLFSPLVDVDFYLNSNADLKQAFGGNREQALTHLQSLGVNERRKFSPVANLDFYLATNADVNTAFQGNRSQALRHLVLNGIREGRLFSEFFEPSFYLQNNSDVNAAFAGDRYQALQHFVTLGLNEGRDFSVPLDLSYYRQLYPDLVAANLSDRQLFEHFQIFGVNERRISSQFFNVGYYLANNQDLRNAGFNSLQAYQHFVTNGLREARNANFSNNVLFNAVASGDATENSAILWTRTADASTQQGKVSDLVVQVATDPQFTNIKNTFVTQTKPDRDYTIKIDNTFLQSNTRYYYRFLAPGGQISQTGTFKTAPNPTDKVPVRMAFSADTAGEWRPYNLSKEFPKLNLDFFVYLGDVIYETRSGNPNTGLGNSPATADPFTDQAQSLADYRRKYLENLLPVNPGGFPGLQTLYASQANYTLLDNHELGDRQFANGGAPAGVPAGAGVDATNPIFDVNNTGSFINKTPGFQNVVLQAYKDYQPIREVKASTPNDPNTNGTDKLYFAQKWGANAVFINVDDRSYRDIRMRRINDQGRTVDDTGDRANNPDRTMLGDTQLEWLKQTLLQAKNDNTTWKIIAISTPIDENASTSGNKIIPLDTGKTWIGGYRAERNEILKFIADNQIKNVVFLSADDHEFRVNELTYFDPVTGARVQVPHSFTVVGGPLAAFGPGLISDRSFENIKSLADGIVAQQQARGADPLGLNPNFPGLENVFREGDPNANTLRQPVDFYSPDTFNYVTLDISGDGNKLSVNTYGINAYRDNTFPEPNPEDPVRRILGFDVQASL
ncbi:alkaline phosphatase D family protein [Floridanema aerugineum]|uniref:Alkaline phosphatase n=1 Tax=Floridaenema aerugineum BLCC-F46 TaxID=3153654 RepID=A0ABV4X1Q0_9CYAN